MMKFYKTLITLLVLLVSTSAFSQHNIHPQQLVDEAKKTANFQTFNLFSQTTLDKNKTLNLGENVTDFSLLKLEKAYLQEIFQTAPAQIELQLPRQEKSALKIELVKVDIFSDGFQVIKGSDDLPANVNLGLHYRGIIKGTNQSFAAISIFENSLMGLISSSAGNYVLGELKNQEKNAATYILYNDKEVLNELGLSCDTPDDNHVYTAKELKENTSNNKDLDNCTRIYIEVDHDIFLDKGGMANTTDYITGLFNQVAAIYSMENMNTEISEMVIWDTNSPYSGGSSSSMLSQFQALRTDFNGDLGELFSYRSSGGIAAGFAGICNANRAASLCFSSISVAYNDVPVYSWTIDVATHELGHLFGSRHTHACVWNGNGTAIDGCSGFTEGSCGLPGNPSEGGTIMSYCHNAAVGKNFSLGFGPQPGNVIRNVIDNAGCLVACGGGNNDPCDENVLSFTLTLDENGFETTWELLDLEGNVMAEGGPYNEPAGTVITEEICLFDDCYSFVIYDSGNNGLCCRNGVGSYLLTEADGNILASGSRFFGSQVANFCLEGGGDDGGGGGGDDPCTDNDLTLLITLDNLGSETTWVLTDDNANLLYEGGPYENNASGMLIEESLCVVDDCFSFTIFDAGGNGLCCQNGNGSYELLDPNGVILAAGNAFNTAETTDFCYPEVDGGTDCVNIDFSAYSIDTYANDDGNGNVLDGGDGLKLYGNNAWKSIDYAYTVTANTKMTFEFKSTKKGEVHGIGFDDDNVASADRTFQVYGTQNWGIDFNTYSSTNWVSFTIPVGEYYTGNFDRLFFIAKRVGRGIGNSYFRNVLVYEGDDCDDAQPAGMLTGLSQGMTVFPNPVTQKLTIQFSSGKEEQVAIHVFNLMGQEMLVAERSVFIGANRLSLHTKNLPAGTYILKVGNGDDVKATRFVKQ